MIHGYSQQLLTGLTAVPPLPTRQGQVLNYVFCSVEPELCTRRVDEGRRFVSIEEAPRPAPRLSLPSFRQPKFIHGRGRNTDPLFCAHA